MKNEKGKVTREADGFKVRFERILNHDIQSVWDAITNPEKLKIWFTDFEMEFKVGGKMTIYFRDEAKTATHGQVVRIDPPHVFEFTWEGEHGLWELSEAGKNKCKLVLTYSKMSDQYAVGAPAGFHLLLERLEKMLQGSKETYPFGTEENLPEQKLLESEYGKVIYKDFPELEKFRPIVIEKLLNAPVEKVWNALTDPAQMKEWYFDIPDFKPEVGHEFSFLAGSDREKWLHLCKVTDVKPNELIAYSWKYDGYVGESHVKFELAKHNVQTLLTLTHHGLHTFPQDIEALKKENFVQGWTEITKALSDFLEQVKAP